LKAASKSRSRGENDFTRYVREKALAAREASGPLAVLPTPAKNEALAAISGELERAEDEILTANGEDMKAGEEAGLGTRLDRLLLTPERLAGVRKDIATVIGLSDPVGLEIDASRRPNGMEVRRVRSPLGVVGIIYEARPNVTVDASVLCLKSGNAVVLKGGSDAICSNRALVAVIRRALEKTSVPADAVQLLDSTDRAVTGAFLDMRGLIRDGRLGGARLRGRGSGREPGPRPDRERQDPAGLHLRCSRHAAYPPRRAGGNRRSPGQAPGAEPAAGGSARRRAGLPGLRGRHERRTAPQAQSGTGLRHGVPGLQDGGGHGRFHGRGAGPHRPPLAQAHRGDLHEQRREGGALHAHGGCGLRHA
jgi:hypothetical protein